MSNYRMIHPTQPSKDKGRAIVSCQIIKRVRLCYQVLLVCKLLPNRLGVELGEQQFNKISNIDDHEISFADIKKAFKQSLNCLSARDKVGYNWAA